MRGNEIIWAKSPTIDRILSWNHIAFGLEQVDYSRDDFIENGFLIAEIMNGYVTMNDCLNMDFDDYIYMVDRCKEIYNARNNQNNLDDNG